MKYYLTLLLILTVKFSQAQTNINETKSSENIIQLALLLDVSNSMDGLINQAKSELWTIVNQVAKAQKNNQSAKLEIALYEYGRTGNDANKGYVKRLLDYTNDLDTISEILFGLTTNGGDEYCGNVIQTSLQELQWRGSDSIYRVIFIAGNEPFNQGKIDYRTACTNAYEKKIFINTIHCGDSATGVFQYWKDGADKGKGKYFFINSNLQAEDIATPYDSLILNLNDSLNKTYWAYGYAGASYKSNQIMQDNNSLKMNKSVKMKRAVSKSSKTYDNAKWDVSDKVAADTTFLEKAKDEELPTELKGRTADEKKKIVTQNTNKRTGYSKEIVELNKKREDYIRTIKTTTNIPKEKTLGDALVQAIIEQAATVGFVFLKN